MVTPKALPNGIRHNIQWGLYRLFGGAIVKHSDSCDHNSLKLITVISSHVKHT